MNNEPIKNKLYEARSRMNPAGGDFRFVQSGRGVGQQRQSQSQSHPLGARNIMSADGDGGGDTGGFINKTTTMPFLDKLEHEF